MNRIIKMGVSFIKTNQNFPVLVLILVNLLMIPFILPHYGESWDENYQYNDYAANALKTYGTWFRDGRSEGLIETSGVAKDLHGPAYVMTVELLTQIISKISPDWSQANIHHLIHFLTFQIGLFSLYILCRRWLNVWSSFGATLLFMTQPVLWGHGFINPKDMPYAALFLLSICLGLRMYDYIFPVIWEQVSNTWHSLDIRTKRTIGFILSIWVLSIIGLFAGTKTISDLFSSMIKNAYLNPNSLITIVYSYFSKNFGLIPADIYIQKTFVSFLRLRGIYVLLSTIFIVRLISKRLQMGLRMFGFPVLIASFALGFITSMRIAGPLAGILIVIYFFVRAGRKAFLPVFIYGFVAIISMYITWPYLWSNPVGHLFESLQVMSHFPVQFCLWETCIRPIKSRADIFPFCLLYS